jgi:hypothetical protein
MVIDSFIFFNELEMLEFRLEELNDYVDYFVLVESDLTFMGEKKELYYKNNIEKFSKFNHKIIHVISELPKNLSNELKPEEYYEILGRPTAPDVAKIEEHLNLYKRNGSSYAAWTREYLQRNDIFKGINKIKVTDEDYIFICDVDEIWDVNILTELENNITHRNHKFPFEGKLNQPIKLMQTSYYYNLDCAGTWPTIATVLCRKSNIVEHGGCNSLRNMILPRTNDYSGWHFSYFMDVERIKLKIRSFSHQEYNTPYYVNDNFIQDKIDKKIDLFERGPLFHHVPFNPKNYWPRNLDILKKLFNL